MKILLTTNVNDVIFNGIVAGFQKYQQHQLIEWYPDNTSMADVIYHNKDIKIVIIDTKFITDTVFKICRKNNIKIISYGLTKHPVDVQLIQGVDPKLYHNIQGTFFVLDKYVNDNFHIGPYDKNKKSDLLVLSNYEISKDFYYRLLDLVSTTTYDLKIIGRHFVNMSQYLGEVTPKETMSFIGSTTMLLDYNQNYKKECIYHNIKHIDSFKQPYEVTDALDMETPNIHHDYELYSQLLAQIL